MCSIILSKDWGQERRRKKKTLLEKAMSKSVSPDSMAESELQGMINSYACLYFSYAVLAHSGYFKCIHLCHRNIIMEGIKIQHQAQLPVSGILPGFSSPFFHPHKQILTLDLLGSPIS